MRKLFLIALVLIFLFGCQSDNNPEIATPGTVDDNLPSVSTAESKLNDVSPSSYENASVVSDPFTPIPATAIEFLLDYSFSVTTGDSCRTDLSNLRREVPLFFFSVAYQRPEMDIALGVSYFNGDFKTNKPGYYQLIQTNENFRNTSLWYNEISKLNNTTYGENYAGAIGEALKNLGATGKEKQVLVLIGDGSFNNAAEVERIVSVLNPQQEVHMVLFCAEAYASTWNEIAAPFSNVKIHFVDSASGSFTWLYDLANKGLGLQVPVALMNANEDTQPTATLASNGMSVPPKFWLNGTEPNIDESAEVDEDRNDTFWPILGDSRWKIHAVELFEQGQIIIDQGAYVIETSKEIPNSYIDDFHEVNNANCDEKSLKIRYTGLGPVLYWVEQRVPDMSEPEIEMTGFPYVITANIKKQVSGFENLSNFESCYTPFLTINDEKIDPKVSASCNSTLCAEQSYLIARFNWPKDASKDAAIHYGFTRRNSEKIVGESVIPPPPFIIPPEVRIVLVALDNQKLTHNGNSIETYAIELPVSFYDADNWDIKISAESDKSKEELAGQYVLGMEDSTPYCPDKIYAITKDSDRIQYSDADPSILKILIMSNVGWNFDKGGVDYPPDKYCSFTAFNIEWNRKHDQAYTQWICEKRKDGNNLVCEKIN